MALSKLELTRSSEAMERAVCPPLVLPEAQFVSFDMRPGEVSWVGDAPPICKKPAPNFFAKWRERLSNAWAALRGEFPYED